ncbi:hypothetical protein [Sinorhizobium terangae]|uniref:Uncharacterized protein n=1 Tax=Sinorhizobium terangae TaxID=110322 RepID=A0A6N7L9M1_SINTE|nr:hypothetical protein [Sinorhizobium terangae]MBB4188046.1 hypothetical protein [Sinorhizobium terangae]MQX14422.1 hypothetical protein [Sinorhizobium terangae]WFU49495.1 hypothetical protein QA637_08915 [Sinorhizobium terangae]
MVGKDYRGPEYHASSGLPVAILVLSVLGITAYLLLAGSLTSEEHASARVYLPAAQTQMR